MFRKSKATHWYTGFILGLAALCACTGQKAAPVSSAVNLAGIFPVDGQISGWKISQPVQTYTHDNLFNLVDGQADSFFAYGFETTANQRYQNAAGIQLNAEVWQLASPADAFGLFTAGVAGLQAAIGNDADTDPGLRLAFWQDRYFVSVSADQTVPDETLMAFGKAIATKLPSGGDRPAILARLPQDGLIDRGYIFFHEEMSVQMEVWLGGGNLLGLSQNTDGVVGRYQLGNATVRLMLIEYPTSGQAAKGLNALQGGDLTDLMTSAVKGKILGAVFGKVDASQAQPLLEEALK